MRQFQESEWDARLDSMLQDLESSTPTDVQQQHQQQQQFYHRQQHQQQSVSYNLTSSNKQVQQQQVRQEVQRPVLQQQQPQQQQYPLSKSQSEGSLHDSAGAMLKDLDNALKASSNYIETHRTVRGPEGTTREYHEVRSFSSGGDRAATGGRADPGDFNLERQVQHMIPVNAASNVSLDRNYSSLQSANMVSSVQQQKTYTTYKVQSNQYSTTGERMTPVDYNDGERPGSRLKQNIDELDTLLSDLNNARGTNGDSGRHTSEYQPHGASSDDYSLSDTGLQGNVKKTVSSFNEYNYQTSSGGQQQTSGGDYYSRKPPSPLPGRRRTGGSPGPTAVLPSPSTARRSSPGPSPSIAITSSSSYNYNLHQSTTNTNGHGPDYRPQGPDYRPQGSDYKSPGPEYRSPGPDYGTSGPSYRSPSPYSPPSDMRRSSPSPSGPRVPSAPRDGTPSGVSYYSKYHSTHTHQSQKSGGPMAFPTNSVPHHGSQTIQSPPKRVDELMSELADFDPSIQPSDIAEPVPSRSRSRHQETTTVTELRDDDDHDYPGSRRHNQRHSPSPVRATKQSSTPGPPVYYPPGEVFSTPKGHTESLSKPSGAPVALASADQSAADGARGRAQMKKEYGYKDKSRGSEGESKGGAAVVPICLPLCCAAPCVIL